MSGMLTRPQLPRPRPHSSRPSPVSSTPRPGQDYQANNFSVKHKKILCKSDTDKRKCVRVCVCVCVCTVHVCVHVCVCGVLDRVVALNFCPVSRWTSTKSFVTVSLRLCCCISVCVLLLSGYYADLQPAELLSATP